MSLAEQLKLADQAAYLGKWLSQEALVRRLAKKTQDGTVGQTTVEPQDEGAEDVGVSVGNTVTHNYYPSASSQPESGTTPPPMASASTLVKWGLVAATLLGGGGLGWLANGLVEPARKDVAQPVSSAPSDQRRLDLEVIPGGASK